MKNLFLCSIILLCSFTIKAQSAKNIIRVDTINLRGTVYTYDGKPARDIVISSRQTSRVNKNYPLSTVTDINGSFKMNGAKPNDTLTLQGIRSFYNVIFENKGSRYVVIYLPHEYTDDLSAEKPVIVSAKRSHAKVIPSFKIDTDAVFIDGLQRMAEFVSGHTGFNNYLKTRLQYPKPAIDHNIEGTVQIGFDVERDGTLINFNILKGIGYGCDEEVLALLKNSPRWKPGIINGKPYTQHETVSVEFKLTDD